MLEYTLLQPESHYNRRLHWAALLTAIATFPLIFVGGLVTSHGAGLAVPDWPNSYGYNMFLFPPSQWIGGIFYEHTHRLMGTVVGFGSLTLCLWAWGTARNRRVRQVLWIAAASCLTLAVVAMVFASKQSLQSGVSHAWVGLLSLASVLVAAALGTHRDERRSVRWLATAVLVGVILQGVLGGLRVVMVDLDLAVIHGCFAQAMFCMICFAALVTSRGWMDPADPPDDMPRSLKAVSGAVVGLIFLQLVIAATMRHYEAGLAVPDLPLVYGGVLPPTTPDALDAINRARVLEMNLPRVSLRQIWLHFAHRVGAIVVTAGIFTLVAVILRNPGYRRRFQANAVLLSLLVLTQFTLGVLTVYYRKPADIASTHVAVGALLFMTSFLTAGAIWRVRRPVAPSPAPLRSKMVVEGNLIPA